MTEGRGQRTDDRKQMTENRSQIAEDRFQGFRCQQTDTHEVSGWIAICDMLNRFGVGGS